MPEPLDVLRSERRDLCDEIASAGPTKAVGHLITMLKRIETKTRRLAVEEEERRWAESEDVRERRAADAAQRRAEDPDAPPMIVRREFPWADGTARVGDILRLTDPTLRDKMVRASLLADPGSPRGVALTAQRQERADDQETANA